MNKQVVLIIEDEPAIRRGIADALAYSGYAVREAADGEDGLRQAFGAGVDLVLLDLMLPKRDGWAVLNEARRARPTLPIIILTARGAEEDRVRGLKDGADDYVVKPFSARELLARVEAVLRRTPARPRPARIFSVAGRRVDLEKRELLQRDGAATELSPLEADLLGYLAANPGRAISREELLERVWGIDPRRVETRAVDMHVARLREKAADDPDNPEVVRTVRGSGYMIGNLEDRK